VIDLIAKFHTLPPQLRILILLYWSGLCLIHVLNVENRTLPIFFEKRSSEPGVYALLRLILTAVFFAAPFLVFKEWLGLEGVLLAVCLLLFYPWWTARHFAIPLKMPRLTYALAMFGGLEWWSDKPEGPVAVAAWCLSRQRTPSEQSILWAESRLNPARPLRASTVAARAMLAASRGRFIEARTLFESMLLLDRRTAPEAIWLMSFEWLVTDAAARGDWTSVQRFTRHHLAPRVATLLLLARVAQRPRGKRRPTILELLLLRVPFRSLDLSPIFADLPKPSKSHILEWKILVDRWEHFISREQLRQHLLLRAATLEGGDAEAALKELQHLLQSDLMDVIGAAIQKGQTIPEDVPLLNAALNSWRRKLVAELNEIVTRMDERRRWDRVLPAIDEWREFLALHRTYSLLSASGDRSGTAFYTISMRLNIFAVWLLDNKKERAIANAIFRFLVSEAGRNKSPERELYNRNAMVSLQVFPPRRIRK
jgi:hypothetical protein